MKAILLAAGRGERLGKAAIKTPKPMQRVKGTPVIEQNIHFLKNYGIRDLYINLHYLGDVISGYLGGGERLGVSIRYSHEETLLGTAGGVKKICSELWAGGINEPFLVMYSDNLFSFDLPSLIAFHKAKAGAATIAVYEKEGDLKGSGVVSIDKDLRVLEFIEKPENPRGTLVNAGLYVLEPKAICQVPCNSFFDFGKDLFPKMLREGVPIFASRVIGSIVPIDTPELLESANAF